MDRTRQADVDGEGKIGYTFGMKVAVSIPDPVFAEAERLAAHLQTSRSDLYARALAAFVGNHAQDRVTEKMNAVVDAVDASPDPFSKAAARRVFERVEW
ncbi:MAG TPA: hypothetical protein VMS43_08405 [Allosphingosinicella sp.]|nr:hypothetical protein [Allosphingosinicella sp.]